MVQGLRRQNYPNSPYADSIGVKKFKGLRPELPTYCDGKRGYLPGSGIPCFQKEVSVAPRLDGRCFKEQRLVAP